MPTKKVARRGAFSPGKPTQFGPLMEAFGVSMLVELDKQFENAANDDRSGFRTSYNPSGLLFEYPVRSTGETHMIEIAYAGRDTKFMTCRYCSSDSRPVAFCTHIAHAIRHGMDRPMFKGAFASNGVDAYLIPVIPTEGVYASLKFENLERDDKPFVGISVELTNRESGEAERKDIGVMPSLGSFGVNELRYMVVDWLWGWMENPRYFFPEGVEPVEVSGIPSVAEINDVTSAFSNRYFTANYGKSLGALVRSPKSSDVPKF